MDENALEIADYRTSDQVEAVFAALAKAQGEIRNAVKDSANPHFRSKYADLAAIVDACRKPLSENGIAVIQIPHNAGRDIGVTTILGHSSGQWISGRIAVAPAKWDAQSLGSVTTYLRRYSLAAMTGVAPEDDDGEGAVGRADGNGQEAAPPQTRGATRAARPAAVPPPRNGNGLNKAALPQTIVETPEVTEARQHIRGLIDQIDELIRLAPHREALELTLDDYRGAFDEIEAAGEAGVRAAQILRGKAQTRFSQFENEAA
jgi:hypothetical protein